MRKFIVCFGVIFILLCTSVAGYQEGNDMQGEEETFKARVIEITDSIEEVYEEAGIVIKTQVADVKILNKHYRGEIVEVVNNMSGNPAYDIELKKGNVITIVMEEGPQGERFFYATGYERTQYIYQVIGIFLVMLMIIGGWKGLKAVISLSITFVLIIFVMIPLLLRGLNPIMVSVAICAVATIVTMIIIAGVNIKSFSAILGTVWGITIGGSIAYLYGVLSKLTGLSSIEAQMLMYIPQDISFDFRGLLFAGILIGALGAAMDVSMSISSALTEMYKKVGYLSFKEVMKHGMNIGKDIMGTMSNTLILAYTGGALSLILLFAAYARPMNEIINLDFVAAEIIRSIAGSIGLLFAIPITALSFALLQKKAKN